MKVKFTLVFSAVCLLCSCGSDNKVPNTVEVAQTQTTVSEIERTTVPTTVSTEEKPTAPATTSAPAPPEDLVLSGAGNVEVYDKLTVGDYITDTNVELAEPSAILDTSELGEHQLSVPYTFGGGTFSQDITYNVVDTTAPVVLNSGWSPTHQCGMPFDLNDYVGFADNYDRAPTLTYVGEVDPNTVGDYPLIATASDSSGNAVSWDVTISVAEVVPPIPDYGEPVAFADFMEKYAADNVRFGIDISTWQGDIDFNAVKNAGCSFVIMRIGYYYSNITMDDRFQANLAGAQAAGLDVGVYIYTTDRSEQDVRDHANWIATQLDGTQLAFPVAYDWEEFGSFQKYGMSIHDLNEYYRLFSDEMNSYGYSAMLYSSKNFLNNFWNDDSKTINPVWLAHFTDQTDYDGEYALWQASSHGRINGIDGNVDFDILYTDRF